ncbi:MAG TPA: LLM class flavin-dependent oxidoreductase [Pseudomonadales bacterium]|nr:LLM class flavin-dependent oxidoreductase [Pseudomonadales bacterium]
MTQLVIRFDMRNPQPGTPKAALYEAALEMAVWADRAGFDILEVSEHHGAEDGYIPSPVVLAAAFAARTKQIRIRLTMVTLPFNHPLRIAEDIAVLDIISNGRIQAGFAGGYVPHEFAMFGIDRARRGQIVERSVEIIKRAWTGDPFEFEGRRVCVRPTPVQQPHPPVWLGGSSPAAARRAARIADHFYTTEQALFDIYRQTALELGKADPGPWANIGSGFFLVTDDPEAEARRMAPYILHECNSYGRWVAAENPDAQFQYHEVTDAAPLLQSGLYPILRPEAALAEIERRGPRGAISLHPLIGGLPPEIGWEQLEYFERRVMGVIRQ